MAGGLGLRGIPDTELLEHFHHQRRERWRFAVQPPVEHKVILPHRARALDGHPAPAGILNDALAKISSHAGAHRSSSAVTRSGIGCNALLELMHEEPHAD